MSLHRIEHSCGNLRAYRVALHAPWYPGQPPEIDIDDAPRASTCRCPLSVAEDGALAERAIDCEGLDECKCGEAR